MKKILFILSVFITTLAAAGKDKLPYPEPIVEPDVQGEKIILSEKKMGYYNLDGNGKFILKIDYKFKDGRKFSSITGMAIAQAIDGGWGLIGVDGAPQTGFIYEAIDGPNECGYYIVKMNGKWGVIDRNCFACVPCKYYCKRYRRSLIFDPVERSPRWEEIVYDVEKRCDSGLRFTTRRMGFCFRYWTAKREVLKAQYGIDWHDPHVMNPYVMFD